jgi:hypothetical protein
MKEVFTLAVEWKEKQREKLKSKSTDEKRKRFCSE